MKVFEYQKWRIERAKNPNAAYRWYVIDPSNWHTPFDTFEECIQMMNEVRRGTIKPFLPNGYYLPKEVK